MKRIGAVVLALLLLASTSAWAQAKPKQTLIGVSIMELTAYTWYLGVIDGCKQWAADNPAANFTFQFEDSHSDVQTMLNNIDNLLAANAKGIILFPADASSAIPTIKQNVAKGIPFVIGDYKQQPNKPSDAVWATFVGHDMRALGVTAGKVAVEYLKTLGKANPVCLFVSRPTSGQVSKDRFEGFRDTVIATFPKARVIEEGDAGAGSRASSQDLVENVLQREPVIDVVCGHNDAEVVGAYNAAVSQKRNNIKFIGIAGDKDVLTFISKGNLAWIGEVLQDPVVLGYQATDAIYRSLIKGEKLPPAYELPQPEGITPANIKNYKWQTWAWL
ncbi:MAG TPA: sugar ABC transporter substrate-binding protein [Rectinemataceae bacterium]|nr:sugar ABC transporter substrate-binding protein [Rectinemataceae bacterium]